MGAVVGAVIVGAAVARALQPSRDKRAIDRNIFMRIEDRFFILLWSPKLLAFLIQLDG